MMAEKIVVACKRCKARKLKCDDDPKICRNCQKAESPCINIDLASRQEYRRGYVEELQARIRGLNARIEAAKAQPSQPTQVQEETFTSPTAGASGGDSTCHADGSVMSMAQLVTAAVAAKAADMSFLDVGLEVAKEQMEIDEMRATPVSLPPLGVARSLVASYLSGPHLLHPFLCRAALLRELEGVYENSEATSKPTMFRLYMVFAIGAISLVRAGEHHIAPVNYYISAMECTGPTLGLSQLEDIQAILLILLFSLQHDIGIGNKWDLARVAMRICIENRFHQKRNRRMSSMTEQMQRRVFWASYVNDRHSSSMLGRPRALEDDEIQIELPIDADDDLVEMGREEAQMLRGISEVSIQLRQISLRRVTSRMQSTLFRNDRSKQPSDIVSEADKILLELDDWRDSFPPLTNARNPYETREWRDLNYFRERLKVFRFLLMSKTERAPQAVETCLDRCLEAAGQVALLYQAMRTSDKLVMNWTCVHDVMSAGFTVLYCGLSRQDLTRNHAVSLQAWNRQLSMILEITSSIIDTLAHIAETWTSVGKHIRIFKALAGKVVDSLQSTFVVDLGGDAASIAPLRNTGEQGPTGDFSTEIHQAQSWNMPPAFSDNMLNLDNIDWSMIDWDEILPSGESPQWMHNTLGNFDGSGYVADQ